MPISSCHNGWGKSKARPSVSRSPTMTDRAILWPRLCSGSLRNTAPCFSIFSQLCQSLIHPLFVGWPWTCPVSCTKHTHPQRLPLRMECRHGRRNRCCSLWGILLLIWKVHSVMIHGAWGMTSSTHLHCLVISILYHSLLMVGPELNDKYLCVARCLSGRIHLR